MTTPTPARSDSPLAPDWGVNYGITHLWSEVLPGFWVGGTGDDDTIAYESPYRMYRGERQPLRDGATVITKDNFDAVVTMYAWARPVGWHVEELRYGIYDSPMADDFDIEALRDTVVWAHKRWSNGKRVLFRCQAGLNRSSLVAALVLIRHGLTAREAIKTIRDGRSQKCLFNTAFVDFLLLADEEYWRA